MDHTLLLLGSFRNCKMGVIILCISQGSLSILDQRPALRKPCISVKTGIKSSTHAHLWSSCSVPGTGLGFSSQKVEQVSCPGGAMCLLGHVLPSSPHTAAAPRGESCSFGPPPPPPPPALTDPVGPGGPSRPLSTDSSHPHSLLRIRWWLTSVHSILVGGTSILPMARAKALRVIL